MSDNPLMMYQRQPKEKLTLPSNGSFWTQSAIKYSETLDVFPLTGQDELLLKNVSSVLLGSVLVEIIQRSIPAIVNAWEMPSIDQDAIMMSIRSASYGSKMKISKVCPICKKSHDSIIDTSGIISQILVPDYSEPLTLNQQLTLWVKPLSFYETNDSKIEETRKIAIIEQLSDPAVDDETRKKLITTNLTNLSIDKVKQIARNIDRISTDTVTVNNTDQIQEWLTNTDRETFNKVVELINKKSSEYILPKVDIKCSECNHQYSTDIDFDAANFLSST